STAIDTELQQYKPAPAEAGALRNHRQPVPLHQRDHLLQIRLEINVLWGAEQLQRAALLARRKDHSRQSPSQISHIPPYLSPSSSGRRASKVLQGRFGNIEFDVWIRVRLWRRPAGYVLECQLRTFGWRRPGCGGTDPHHGG